MPTVKRSAKRVTKKKAKQKKQAVTRSGKKGTRGKYKKRDPENVKEYYPAVKLKRLRAELLLLLERMEDEKNMTLDEVSKLAIIEKPWDFKRGQIRGLKFCMKLLREIVNSYPPESKPLSQ